jgi:polyribonucleotide nucleotidyltransferase
MLAMKIALARRGLVSTLLKGRAISYSVGKIGHLADSSLLCQEGNSVVHAALCINSHSADADFLALTVDYRSRMYATGQIPDNAARRERPNDEEDTIVARFVDRAMRPMFPKGMRCELQLTLTTHAADGIHDPTVAAVNASSMALLNSGLPWNGPIGCVRVGRLNGELVVNPPVADMRNSTLNLLYAGNRYRPVM